MILKKFVETINHKNFVKNEAYTAQATQEDLNRKNKRS
jgi:hypothetical protein